MIFMFPITFRLVKVSHIYRLIFLILFIAFIILGTTTHADNSPKRPKIALVLAGGGAKGAAHIGVLKVLEQQRIPIHIVTGTSIGSVIGGLYALGYDADTIENKMLSTDFNQGYSDAIPRENLRYRRKQQKDQLNVPFELGILNGSIVMPSGALQGQSTNQIIRNLTGLVPNQTSFDDLAIPYRAIATSLGTRETISIDQGSLTVAMRASSSVPGALAPEPYQGMLLIDGGISNNIPIEQAKALGADIIIAVDISGQLKSQSNIKGALSVISQLTSFLTNEGTHKQISLLSNTDILIRPDINGMQMTDFSIMPKALEAGEEAAIKNLTALQQLSVSEIEYKRYQAEKHRVLASLVESPEETISSIIIDNQSPVHIDYIDHYLTLTPGQKIHTESINQSVDRLYSSDEFQKVDIDIRKNDNNDNIVNISTEKKAWGPNFLEFGIGWEGDISDESTFNLDIAHTKTNLTEYGAQWRNEINLGTNLIFTSEFYAPLVATRWLYSSTRYEFERKKWNLFNQNSPLFSLDKDTHIAHIGLGWNYHQSGFFESGLRAEYGKLNNSNVMSDLEYNTIAPYLYFGFDNLNNINFPSKGKRITVSIFTPREHITQHDPINLPITEETYNSYVIDISWKGAIHINNHAMVSKASWAKAQGENNESVYNVQLGGFLNLSGYHRDALIGEEKAFAALIYQWDLGKSILNLKQYPLYVGLSLEAGNTWYGDQSVSFSNTIKAGSIFLGTDTKLGPAAIALGITDDKKHAVYFYLGKNF